MKSLTLSAGSAALDRQDINNLVSDQKEGTAKPAVLQMWLGPLMIEEVFMWYKGCPTATDKQQYQEKVAAALAIRHNAKIIKSGLWPVFFVVQQSKM